MKAPFNLLEEQALIASASNQPPITLTDLMRIRAETEPDALAYTYLVDGQGKVATLTYGALGQRAQAIAAELRSYCEPGARALLLYPPGLDYIAAFFGCLYAGVVAVPAYPPRNARGLPRVRAIAADAEPALALTTAELRSKTQALLNDACELEGMHWLTTDTLAADGSDAALECEIKSDTVAFLQYTSGSTGAPKGVMLTHGNLIHNSGLIAERMGIDRQTVGVSWLPPYHDMGLIGGILQPLYSGCHCVFMTPVSFLQQPYRWLEAITKYRGTVSGGPNFAYELCVRRVTPEQRARLDLSSWQLAFNGAEPVRADTLRRFAETFSSCGFREKSIYPCYGLAEATLFVSSGSRDAAPVIKSLSEPALEANHVIEDDNTGRSRELVSSGQPAVGQEVIIVDPETATPCAPNRVGEIWVAGPSIGQGYWKRPEDSEQVFRAGLAGATGMRYLRTGDLGFLYDGELFVSGRRKDMVILNGRNLYPQDIELTVERSHSALRPGGGAAFATEIRGEERLVVVQELEFRHRSDLDEVFGAIRQGIAETHEAPVHVIALIKPGSLPKTSSGKVQRHACRQRFLDDSLDVLGHWSLADGGKLDAASAPAPDVGTDAYHTATTPQEEVILTWLTKTLAARVQMPEHAVNPGKAFTYYGLGSADAAELIGEMEERVGRPLSPTLFFEYPTPLALSAHLATLTGDTQSPHAIEYCEDSKACRDAGMAPATDRDVAIVAVACRFPEAKTPEAFWEMVCEGRDAVTDSPAQRPGFGPGTVHNGAGGFLPSIDGFDANLFGLSDEDARVMDPQQRLLLEVVWELIERAGYSPQQLAVGRTGVYIGMSTADYLHLAMQSAAALDPRVLTGNGLSMAASRISYLFNWRGPSLVIDTACSSSLVALHTASQALKSGEIDAAVAGGVNLILSPHNTDLFARAGMLSNAGRCKAFDDQADGYVRSEGIGAVLVKRVCDAHRDRDQILAIVRGSAVNHDGAAKVGLTAPNPHAQRELLADVYARAGVDPSSLGMLEAHATGTFFGDSIEARALSQTFKAHTSRRGFCAIGTVKSNLGHCEAASGMAALIRAVLAVDRGMLPPTLHVQQPNRHIAFEDTPFYINDRLRSWHPEEGPRRAGVSAFGFSGVNAHLVLEQSPARPGQKRSIDRPVHVLTLSAVTQTALEQLVAAYRTYLSDSDDTDIGNICHTANVGRQHLSHRLAMVVRYRDQLHDKLYLLKHWEDVKALSGSLIFYHDLNGPDEDAVPLRRRVISLLERLSEPGRTAVLAWSAGHVVQRDILPALKRSPAPALAGQTELDERDWERVMTCLAALHVLGAEIDWAAVDQGLPRERVLLPTYPFEHQRHWLQTMNEGANEPAAAHVNLSSVTNARDPGVDNAIATIPQAAGSQEDRSQPCSSEASCPPALRAKQIEGWLRRLIAGVLDRPVEQIDLDTSFLELGLDSIPTMRVIHFVEQGLSTRISPLEIFEHPNIRALAAFLDARLGPLSELPDPVVGTAAGPHTTPTPVPEESTEPFSCTELQIAYFMARNLPAELGGRSCQAYLEVDVPKPLDPARLQEAFDRLIQRHSMLRTVFRNDGQQQVLAEVPPNAIEVEDLRAENATAREARCLEVREQISRADLVPERWPLFAIGACWLTDECFRLFINVDMLQVDFLSLLILLEEWRTLYEDPNATLRPLPGTFQQYVASLQQLRQSEHYHADKAYWFNRLSTFPPPPALPVRTSAGKLVRPNFASQDNVLAAETWRRLKSLASAHQVTPSALLCAAYCRVLQEWCGQDRFALNLPLFNRYPINDGDDIDALVGPFTTNVLLDIEWERSADFWAQARRIHLGCLEALEHRLFTGVEFARALSEHRRSGLKPPAPVVFTPALYEGKETLWGEIRLALSQTAMVWLDCIAVQDGEALRLFWDYVEALFEPSEIRQRFNQFIGLLEGLLEDEAPQSSADRPGPWPGIAADEWRRIEAINDTAAPYPHKTLHALIGEQAQRTPEAPAVIAGETVLSYRELEDRSNQVACALIARGVERGDRVVIMMGRGTAAIVGILGVLKAGAAYVPLDPSYPAARRDYVLQYSRPKLLLSERAQLDVLAARLEAPTIDILDISADEIVQAPDRQASVHSEPEDLAYVIYTSGSTGRPKGAMLTHGNAVNTVYEINRRFGIGPGDRVFGFSSMSFDLSVYDIFGSLISGAALVTLPEASVREPGHWMEILKTARVTVWNSVPTAMKMLLDFCEGRIESHTALRLVMLSGDWIPVTLPDRIKGFFTNSQVISLGGPTECCIWQVSYAIEQVEPGWRSIPYGTPLANHRFYLLDDALRPVPFGDVGEMYIAGDGVGLGYWDDPRLTDENFIVHPVLGQRVYRSGDIGRYLPDGNIEILGRADHQVKIRGFRVELGEIETALLAHAAVDAVAVVAWRDRAGDYQLAGYYVTTETVAASALRTHLKERLPEYMVPGQLIELDALPLNDNNKIDRKALIGRLEGRMGVGRDGGDQTRSAASQPAGLEIPTGVSLFDPAERDAFKRSQPGLRRGLETQPALSLPAAALDREQRLAYAERQSWRAFDAQPISQARLSGFLSALRQLELNGQPKYRWASGGGLYPVQVYLDIKPERCEGVVGGSYYYDPRGHRLVQLGGDALSLTPDGHYPHNRQAFLASAFTVFLVGEQRAIEPMYGSKSLEFCLIEAGLLTQLLEDSARVHGLGLCQIGGVDLNAVARALSLEDSQRVLHCVLGGALGEAEQAKIQADSAALRVPEATLPAAITASVAAAPTAPAGEGSGTADQTRVADIQQTLLGMWREMFSVEDLDVEDNFFEIGGNSQLAINAIRRASDALGVEIDVADLFSYPTIARLSRYLAGKAPAAGDHGSRAREQTTTVTGAAPATMDTTAPFIEAREATATPADSGNARAPRSVRASSAAPPAGAFKQTAHEPIAVIGMSGRFPQAEDLEQFWSLLREGVDAITEVPSSRWDVSSWFDPDMDKAGRTYGKWGSFLDKLEYFDPLFFRLSPTEARAMDPQQRLLLEVAWEAIEAAGYGGGQLAGSQTGVFIGASYTHHRDILGNPTLDPYLGIGNHNAILANRLSYFLDLHGPCLTVDTLCSSSLVALNLALQGLRRGECDYAVVGGVQAQLSPQYYEALSRLRALSPTGRCHTFDRRADGYVPGEGVGVVLLKRLSQAQADRDPVCGVIRGAGVNHGGQAAGLTVPNPLAQAAVIRAALDDADVPAEAVGYLEAHGTGTSLGDPIEIDGLARAFGEDTQRSQFCAIGALKTNLGHLEPAAGVAALIKVLLALRAKELPPTLHIDEPNPNITFEGGPFYVNDRLRPWHTDGRPRVAGISGFGMGGTNAHVIVEEAPTPLSVHNSPERPLQLLALSARSATALKTLAARYVRHLEAHPEQPLADVCFTANTGRARFAHRLGAVARTPQELATQLASFARTGASAGVYVDELQGRKPPKVAMLFTGQGAQRPGMARALYESQPVFRRTLDRCARLLEPYLEQPLLSVLYAEEDGEAHLNQTAYTQPALFAVEYALYELWRSWGVEPAAVLGHSAGEYVAACVAGVFSLEEGLGLIAERGRLMQALPPGGRMLVVFADAASVAEALTPYAGQVAIAAVNGPANTVVSGQTEAVARLAETFQGRGVRTHPLEVSHAFHSPLVEPMLEEFRQAASTLTFHAPQVSLISNLTGRAFQAGEVPDADYWCRHVRGAVRFAEGVQALAETGCSTMLELGPGPVLCGMGRQILPGAFDWLPSLEPGKEEWSTLLSSLAALHCRGVAIDWTGFDSDYQRRRLPLPTYPFERVYCWLEPQAQRVNEHSAALHPLLDRRLELADRDEQEAACFEKTLTVSDEPLLAQHRVRGQAVLPGVAQLEMLRVAAQTWRGHGPWQVRDVTFTTLLSVAAERPSKVRVWLEAGERGMRARVLSRPEGGEGTTSPAWSEHAHAVLVSAEASPAPARLELSAVRARLAEEVSAAAVYERACQCGLEYGPRFQTLEALHLGGDEALARLHASERAAGYELDPGLLDGALQALGVLLALGRDPSASDQDLFVPFSVESVTVFRPLDSVAWVLARRTPRASDRQELAWGEVTLTDDQGEVLVKLEGVCARRLPSTQPAAAALDGWLHVRQWRPVEMHGSRTLPSGDWLVFTETGGLGEALCERLQASGRRCIRVSAGAAFACTGPDAYTVRPDTPEDYIRLFEALNSQARTGLGSIVHFWSCATPPARSLVEVEQGLQSSAHSLLYLVQALARHRTPACELWFVTQGSQAVGAPARPVHAEAAAAWGLLRVVAKEYRQLTCRGLDMPPSAMPPAQAVEHILSALALADPPAEVAHRDGQLWAAEVEAVAPGDRVSVPDAGVFLITGGQGDLGLEAARALAAQGPVRLVLLNRTALPPESEWATWLATHPDGDPVSTRLRGIKTLQASGAEVWPVAGDVADEAAMARLVETICSRYGCLDGVFHAAGILRDGLLHEKSPEAFCAVLRPKVHGAWVLDRVTRACAPRWFVLFSSIAGLYGNVGQGDYAAANAYLDALAAARHGEGLPALALDWGPWSEVGMAARAGIDVRAFGLEPITPGIGRELLLRAMAMPVSQLVLLRLSEPRPARASARPLAAQAPVPRPAGLQRRLQAYIVEELARPLGLAPADIDPEINFMELGFDSIMAVQVKQSLEEAAGIPLDPTLLFEYPSVHELSQHLAEAHGEQFARLLDESAAQAETVEPAPPEPLHTSAPSVAAASDDGRQAIAVIALACRFPNAETPEAFWQQLRAGADLITEVPENRWDWRSVYDPAGERPGTTRSKWGGFINGVDGFDPAFFGLSPREARLMDPQQRLFLEVAWECLERAGYRPEQLASARTAVFVGIAANDYPQVLAQAGLHLDAHAGAGNVLSMVANRTSYIFNWRGPSLAVDTACSSSLVSVDMACEQLRSGQVDVALVGGVNLILAPYGTIIFSQAGMLAADGRCKTFDDRADGYVRGEGIGAVLLKPLDRALRDGDDIWAVIRGTAVNHDGHSKVGLTAPNPKAQRDVILSAYDRAGVSAESIGYLEAHGTGTSMGDPIEIRGLSEAFRRDTDRRGYCAIGSVKTNIGHLEPAAGIAGLIKVVLALRHGELPPSLHVKRPNASILFEGTPFYINDRLRPWVSPSGPRCAAVSSFGFGGVNAHAVLEEAPSRPLERPVEDRVVHVLALSARSPAALGRHAEGYRNYLDGDAAADIRDICFTANTGRRHFRHRLAVLAREHCELSERLQRYGIKGPGGLETNDVFLGQVQDQPELSERERSQVRVQCERLTPMARAALRRWCSGPLWEDAVAALLGAEEVPLTSDQPKLDADAWEALMRALAKLYVLGVDVDWEAVDRGLVRRRVPLPTYPFERKRYWVGHDEEAKESVAMSLVPEHGLAQDATGGEPGDKPRPAESANETVTAEQQGTIKVELLRAAPQARQALLERYLSERIARALQVEPEAIAPGANLMEFGLDSVATMDVIGDVRYDLELAVYPGEVMQRPSVRALAQYLAGELDRPVLQSTTGAQAVSFLNDSAPNPTIVPVAPDQAAGASRNPPPVFLLSTPRAGSTLLRVMLAGHPRLFCPPELHLLGFEHMRERAQELQTNYLNEGLERAIMELKDVDHETARALVEDLARRDLPVQEVYQMLQALVGERLLVDKSPSYGASPETLARAEAIFEQPKYIWLIRHPYAVIESFVRNRMDRMLGMTDVEPVEAAERVWATINENILAFVESIDPARYRLIRYEDLVSAPWSRMQELCAFLGIPFDEAVIRPYEGERMTDGVQDKSLPIGDPNFFKHRDIDASLADTWKTVKLPRPLSERAQTLATEFGYVLNERSARAPLSRAPSACAPLVPIRSAGSKRPVFCFHPGGGQVFVYQLLAERLGSEQPIFALQSRALNDFTKEHTSLEAMAADYAQVIREQQPHGPYDLLGWSMGGHLAVCTAAVLERQGERVDFVGLWDSRYPSLAAAVQDDPLRGIALAFGGAIGDAFARLDQHERDAQRAKLLALGRHERLEHAIAWAQQNGVLEARLPTENLIQQAGLVEVHIELLRDYRPPCIAAPIHVWWAREDLAGRPPTDWGEFTRGPVYVFEAEGNHFSMVRPPNIDALCAALRERLLELRRQGEAAPVQSAD